VSWLDPERALCLRDRERLRDTARNVALFDSAPEIAARSGEGPSSWATLRIRSALVSRFKTNPWDLSELLALLDSQKVVLPEFQRDFVWWPKDVDLLLTSLVQDFPAGSLLFLRSDGTAPLAWRPVAGVNERADHSPDYLVLDGQQRLTSLSLALNGRGDHVFFLDLEKLEAGDLDNGLHYMRREQAEKRSLLDRQKQFDRHQYPLGAVFGRGGGFEDWFEDYVFDLHSKRGMELQEARERVRRLRKTYVDPLRQYRFPVVELPAETSLEAVCQIFETLNKTGMKLTVFDLLTAKFWPHGIHLRDMLREAREARPILGVDEFDVEATYLLQAVSLLRTQEAPRCKRGDLLQLVPEDFEQDWATVTAAAGAALTVLRDDCGVLRKDWLPYAALLPSLFAAAVHAQGLSGPQQVAAWDKIRRWYWCASFGQRYEGPVNTLNAADFRQLLAWFNDDAAIPEAVASFSVDQLDLRAARRQRSALYRAVICLTIAHGARDFHTGKRITADLLHDPELHIEDHHVVPSGFLKKLDPPQPREDSVLNRSLIDAGTNRVIRDRPPKEYLSEIADAVGAERLEEILDSHFLPSGEGSALYRNPFEVEPFLMQREELLLPAIAAATGAELPDARLQDVYLQPDQPFTSDLALRRLIRQLRGEVLWYEQHMDRKALEVLIDELPRDAVTNLRLLSGPANLSAKARRAFERFHEELSAAGLSCEWRVIPADEARDLHARAIFDSERGYELPPLASILKGTVDSIRESRIPREPFEGAWRGANSQPLLEMQLS
jgi:hypothetical protein